MSWDGRKLAILMATVLAAFGVLVSSAMLISDVAVARKYAPIDAAQIEALEAQARSDAGAAEELEAERKRQTERSLARDKVNRRLGWMLLVATAGFVTGIKWLLARQSPTISNALLCLPPFEKGGTEGGFLRREPEGPARPPRRIPLQLPLFQRGRARIRARTHHRR